MTFERREETTQRTETPSVFSHTIRTTERHSFSKEEVMAALGLEVPEGYTYSMYLEEPDAALSTRPGRLLVTLYNTEVRS